MKYIVVFFLLGISSLSAAQNVTKDTIDVFKPVFTGKYYSTHEGINYEIWKDSDGLYFIIEERKLYIK